jgi:hypothetical protein
MVSLVLSRRLVGRAVSRPAFAVLAGLSLLFFHPLILLLERGQIDALNLAILLGAIVLFTRRTRGADAAGGMLLAVVLVVKTPAAYFLPLLLLRRKGIALAGVAAGVVLLNTVAVAAEGPVSVRQYWRDVFPLMARAVNPATSGPPEPRLPSGLKQGVSYVPSELRFGSKASAADAAYTWILSPGRRVTRSHLSVLFYAAGLSATVYALGLRRLRQSMSPLTEGLFWSMAMTLVMLTGPLTWAMNLVWLIPLGPMLYGAFREATTAGEAHGIAVAAVGFMLIALPDPISAPVMLQVSARALNHYYVLPEATVLLGLLLLLRARLTLGI